MNVFIRETNSNEMRSLGLKLDGYDQLAHFKTLFKPSYTVVKKATTILIPHSRDAVIPQPHTHVTDITVSWCIRGVGS